MWNAPQGFTKKHAEYLEFWLREERGLHWRDERTIFLDGDDRIMSMVQYDKAKAKGWIPTNVKQDGYVIANFDLRKGYVVRPPLTAHRPPPTAHRPPPTAHHRPLQVAAEPTSSKHRREHVGEPGCGAASGRVLLGDAAQARGGGGAQAALAAAELG